MHICLTYFEVYTSNQSAFIAHINRLLKRTSCSRRGDISYIIGQVFDTVKNELSSRHKCHHRCIICAYLTIKAWKLDYVVTTDHNYAYYKVPCCCSKTLASLFQINLKFLIIRNPRSKNL